jgi:hypothetical protein
MPRPERHVFVCGQSRPPGHAIFDEHLLGGEPVARLRVAADIW